MKHTVAVTKQTPAQAFTEGHPDTYDSIVGFLKDPIGTINLHLDKGGEPV